MVRSAAKSLDISLNALFGCGVTPEKHMIPSNYLPPRLSLVCCHPLNGTGLLKQEAPKIKQI